MGGVKSNAAGLITILLAFTVASAIAESSGLSSYTSSSTSDDSFTEIGLGSSTQAPQTTLLFITITSTTSTSSTMPTLTTSTSGTSTTTSISLPAAGTKLIDDYERELPRYNVVFKAEPEDYIVKFTAYDTPLKMKPISLAVGATEVEPSFDLHYLGEDSVEYRNIFGEGIDLKYETEDRILKESLIIKDEGYLSLLDMSPSTSSSTMGVTFIIIPSDRTVPSLDGKTAWAGDTVTTGDDIYFIRKKEPHRLYAVNEFYRIKAPYLIDDEKTRVNLTYTLEKQEEGFLLTLNIPPLPEGLQYPLTIDPTIYYDEDNNGYEWLNDYNCATTTYCSDYEPEDEMRFRVPDDCATNGGITKPIFKFETSDLGDQYYGDLDEANIYIEGTCSGQSSMHDGERIRLVEIGDIGDDPGCEGYYDEDEKEQIINLMADSYCTSDIWVDVTDNLEGAINGETDLSFKIDIYDLYGNPRNSTDEPPDTIYYNIIDSKLQIEYWFTCEYYDDCIVPDEFCWDYTGGLCQDDLTYGEYCEDIATHDEDDYACPNDNCQYDDFDEDDHYCVEDNKCVHDGIRYDPGYIHCYGELWWKNCTGTTWTTRTNCSYGCDDEAGCLTHITNQYPPDQSTVSVGATQTFNFSVWEGTYPLENVSLYMNLSSVWQRVNTTATPSNGTVSLSYNIPTEGTYIWSGEVYDNQGNKTESPQNYTIYATTTTIPNPNIQVSPSQLQITVIK